MADLLNIIGSVVILVEGVLGIAFSGLVIFIYFYGSSDKTSFNLICLSRAINNVLVLGFNFLILDFPTMLLSKNFWPGAFESLIIVITVNLYMVNEYQTILIAVNRFIAIFLPLHYHKLFSNKVAAVFLTLLYLERGYASVSKLYTTLGNGCVIYWRLDDFRSLFTNSTCATAFPSGFDGYLILILPLAVFALTILLNLMTFAKILRFYLVGSHNMDSETMASVKNNIRLFFQTVLQDSLFFVDVLFTFRLSSLSEHRTWLFISTVFVWESIHMLDGSRNFYPLEVESVIIASTINIYMVNSYHCILIGTNRFIAMYAPMYYSKLCGIKVTLVILIAFYLERVYAIISRLYNVFDKHCKMYLSLDTFSPRYENSTCSKQLKDDFNGILIVIIPLAIFSFTFIMNIATFAKILQFYMGKNQIDSESAVLVRKNIRMFFQTVLQDSCFFIDIIFTFKLSSLSDHRVWHFISAVLIWESIHMLDGSTNFYPDIIETIIITATINVYLVNQLQTVVIALNRFIALYLPLNYKTLCSNQVTSAVLALLYLQRGFATGTKLYDLISNDCKIHMDSQSFYTAYTDKNCSKKVPVDSDLIVLMPSIFLSITIVLNLATFAKILRFYFKNNLNSESTSLAMKNIRLFFQTLFQDALFLIDATFTFKLSALSDSRVWTFISTVFVWESIHTLDGLIMLMFSDRLSILRARFTRIVSNQVSSTSEIGGSNPRGARASSSMPGVA